MSYVYLWRLRGKPRSIEIDDFVIQTLTHQVVSEAVWSINRGDLPNDGVRISPRAAKEIGFPEDAKPDHIVGVMAMPETGLPFPCPVRFNVDPNLPEAVALVVDCKHPKKFPARCVVFYEGVPMDDVPEELLNAYRNDL